MAKIFFLIKCVLVFLVLLFVMEYEHLFYKENLNTIENKIKCAKEKESLANKMVFVAESFLNIPYNKNNICYKDSLEIKSLNYKDFIENCVAISLCSSYPEGDLDLYRKILNKISYRDIRTSDISYFLNWKNNLEQNNLASDFSEYYDGEPIKINKKEQFFYISPSKLQTNILNNGDILTLLSNTKEVKLIQVGIVKIINQEPYLIYSTQNKGITISNTPIKEFLKQFPHCTGVMLISIHKNIK